MLVFGRASGGRSPFRDEIGFIHNELGVHAEDAAERAVPLSLGVIFALQPVYRQADQGFD